MRLLPIERMVSGSKRWPNAKRFVDAAYTQLDDEDYDRAKVFRWCFSGVYPCRWESVGRIPKRIFLHKEIAKWAGLRLRLGETVDHIDRNPLNCQRFNLRSATKSQQEINKGLRKDSTSGHAGVSWRKNANKWEVYICFQGKRVHLGYFSNKQDAIRTSQCAAETRDALETNKIP